MAYFMYLRKSRADRAEESVEEVLARHCAELQEFAARCLGGAVPEERILREVVSGETIAARPAFQRLLKIIESPEAEGVLVVDIARLSRGDREDSGRIINAFRYSDTRIITPYKSYDLSDKYDRKFVEMDMDRGSDYLEYFKEIQRRGRLASVKAGNFVGSLPPYGYDKVKDGKRCTLAVNPTEGRAVRAIFDLFVNENQGCTDIARRLDALGFKPRTAPCWKYITIRSILTNPVYTGVIRWNWRKEVKQLEEGRIIKSRPRSKKEDWIVVRNAHPPIVSEALFQAAQAKVGLSSRENLSRPLANPLAGILRCQCGYAMVRQNQKGGIRSRVLCAEQPRCHTRSAAYDDLFQAVLQGLRRSMIDFDLQIQPLAQCGENVSVQQAEHLNAQLQKLERQLEKQYDYLESGLYSEEQFKARREKLEAELHRTGAALRALRQKAPGVQEDANKTLSLRQAIDALSRGDIPPKAQNAFLRAIVRKIVYSFPRDAAAFQVEIFLK